MNEKKRFNVKDALELVTAGDQSDVSDFSDDEESDDMSEAKGIADIFAEESDEDSETEGGNDGEVENAFEKLIEDVDVENTLSARASSAGKKTPAAKRHTFRWRKHAAPITDDSFHGKFSDPPKPELTPLQYFKLFFTDEAIALITKQTNLYSVQKSCKSIDVDENEIATFIGMNMLMGVVKLPSYKNYWSQKLRYPMIADAMPIKRFEKIKRYLHFSDNDKVDKTDKLGKIQPIVNLVRNECIKVEPEEFHAIDEQIIPSKTKFSKIRQYNPKKPRKWGFKNLVRAGSSGLMYDFYIYSGKEEEVDAQYEHLQKSAQVVARLCKELPCHQNHKVFFDNWFTTLDLMLYMLKQGYLSVGTVRSNRTQGCPLTSNKELEKKGRGSYDYKVDNNSGIIIVKWVDNSTVLLVSNYVGVMPVEDIDRWCKKASARKAVPCPQIVVVYNKCMGGVDLADMLIALYRIEVKTMRWYVKIFWHLVDIAKVNAWLLYRRHYEQAGKPKKYEKSLLEFTTDIADALMHANKVPRPGPGRPTKRQSTDNARPGGKKAAVPTPIADVRYDKIAHWPKPSSDKKRCRLCHSYSRTTCEKCRVSLCLLTDRNCFKLFHTA